MNNAVLSAMPTSAVMKTLGVADQVMQLRKVGSLRDLRGPARRLSFMALLPPLLLGACAEWPAPRTETNRILEADRYWREGDEQRRRLEAERFKQEIQDFQRRKRSGR